LAHISLPPDAPPGIVGLFKYRPELATALSSVAEVLLRGPSTLSLGEREAIAAYVSYGNECRFCTNSHAAFAKAQFPPGESPVDAVCRDLGTAPISEKFRSLLAVADQVRKGGKHLTDGVVRTARAHGATDLEIHDVVAIAAAFCMFNRYVDGLGTAEPSDPAAYDAMASAIVEHGYLAAL
jgi:uncharacterized peroxidase-related enzyme